MTRLSTLHCRLSTRLPRLQARPHPGVRANSCSDLILLIGLVCLLLAPGLRAAAAAETNRPPTRPISLEECIQMALLENLDLRIERMNPSLFNYDVELARAGYDPSFTFSADHDYRETGGRFFTFATTNAVLATNTLQILGDNAVGESDTLASGIRGLGPYGLSYDLSGVLTDSRSSSDLFFQTDPFQQPRKAVVRSESVQGSVGLTLTQPLLRNFLIDGTRWNIAVARNRLKSSEFGLRLQIINILTAVERAYYALIFARENVQVQTEGLRLAQRLFADDQKRVQIGMIPRLDEKQSESQVSARQADLIAALGELGTAQNNLKILITSSYRDLHQLELEPTAKLSAEVYLMNLQASWEKGLEQRADLQQAKLEVERQGINLKYFRNQRLPELNIRGTYGHGASGDAGREYSDALGDFRSGDKPFWGVGAVFSIPLGNKSARERYRQGKLTADQLVLELKKREEAVLVEIDEALRALRTAFEQVQSRAKARAYAEEALSAEQKKLDSGKSTSFVVLQLQRDLISARSDEIRALRDYNQAVAELHRAEGTTLEHRKINLEVK